MASLLWCAAAAASALAGAHATTTGVLPHKAPIEVRDAYKNGTWLGLNATEPYAPLANYPPYCPCACTQYDDLYPISDEHPDQGYNTTGTHTRAPVPHCYCLCDSIGEPIPPSNTTDSGDKGGDGMMPPPETMDGEKPPPAGGGTSGDTASLDDSTLCTLNPGRTECAAVEPSDPAANLTFQWHAVQLPEAPCPAATDLWGHCGDANATVTAAVVCQAVEVSASGAAPKVLKQSVTTEELEAFIAEYEKRAAAAAEKADEAEATPDADATAEPDTTTDPDTTTTDPDTTTTDPDTTTNDPDTTTTDPDTTPEPPAESDTSAPPTRRLQQMEGFPESFYAMTVDNMCTEDFKPSAASRTSKCAERDCDVLKVQNRTVGPCFSEQDLPCGPMVQVSERRCFSPQKRIYIDDPKDMEDSACADATMGLTVANCTTAEEEPCPEGAFWRYKPWGACSAECDAEECDGLALCMPAGTRSREVKCVKFESDAVVDADEGECDDAEKPESEGDCERRCFNREVRHKREESACVAVGDDACGPGEITTTFTLCDDAAEMGCAAYADTATTTRPCYLGSCKPCEDFCVAANTLESEADMDTYTCACTCREGFGGSRCHKDLSDGAAAPVVYDADGVECPSAVLDLSRRCCAYGLDGCGMCKDVAYADFGDYRIGLDAQGQCCHHTADTVMLTGDFTCCAGAEELDECGVCRGDASTCRKSASAELTRATGVDERNFALAIAGTLPDGVEMFALDGAGAEVSMAAPARRLRQAPVETYGTEPTTVEVSAGRISTKYFAIGKDPGFADPVLTALPEPAVQGRADNGVCETGEPEASSDCPEPTACPLPSQRVGADVIIGRRELECGGNGVCGPVGGRCVCAKGYMGDGCDECDWRNKYVDVTVEVGGVQLTACTLLASDSFEDPIVVSDPPGPDDSTTTTPRDDDADEDGDGGLGGGAIAGIVIGVIGGVAVLGGIAYYFVRAKGAKDIGPA